VGNKIYTSVEMVEILRRLESQLNRPVLASDIDERAGPLHRAIEREFVGMAKARKVVGINNS
jgi:hypothetical protein